MNVVDRDPALQSRIRKTGWLLALLVAALFSGSTAFILANAPRPPAGEKVPVLLDLPDFALEDAAGARFARQDLAGKAWVFNFVFTRCSGPCPGMTRQMAALQQKLLDDQGIRLVSVTVDPAHDTRPVLAEYAKLSGARPDRWLFVTGDKKAIFSLSKDGFKLGVEDAKEASPGIEAMPLLHSTRFALVDGQGRIRGYYDGTDEQAVGRLVADARAVATEAMP